MGIFYGKPEVSSDDCNIVIEDPNYRVGSRSDISSQSRNMVLDAFYTKKNKTVCFYTQELTRECVQTITAYLDVQDKISLIYLLFDDSQAEIGLEHSLLIEKGSHLDVLDDWVSYSISQKIPWQNKLLEAMSIIQHYQALKALGHEKEEINIRFLPTSKHTSLYIPLKKKKLFLLLERFTAEKAIEFLRAVEKDFERKDFSKKFERYNYLEMYLMHWISIKYITSGQFENISRALKMIDMLDEAEDFKNEDSEIDDLVTTENTIGNPYLGRSISIVSSTSGSSSAQHDRDNEKTCYQIDRKIPGICLIINQKEFKSNPEGKCKLDKRTGTDIDRDRLIKTFKRFNYEIIMLENLTHIEIQEKIALALERVEDHSSFITCILSHGFEGSVYGVNSIPVKIEAIKTLMCTKNKQNLKGKPKVLILQSCQGNVCQEADIRDEPNYKTDGPSATADLLVCYATVPGFGAVRDKRKGTWFIQSLCNKIDTLSNNSHLEDICTFVQGEVSHMKFMTSTSYQTMMPMKTSTLTKFFYLPKIGV